MPACSTHPPWGFHEALHEFSMRHNLGAHVKLLCTQMRRTLEISQNLHETGFQELRTVLCNRRRNHTSWLSPSVSYYMGSILSTKSLAWQSRKSRNNALEDLFNPSPTIWHSPWGLQQHPNLSIVLRCKSLILQSRSYSRFWLYLRLTRPQDWWGETMQSVEIRTAELASEKTKDVKYTKTTMNW